MIADHLQVAASDVIFTSGGTMADNLALRGIHAARQRSDPRLDTVVVSAVEHHAVLDAATAAAGERVVRLPVDEQGRLLVSELARVLAADSERISVVSVMSANNEVGTAQPISEVAQLCDAAGVPLHVDAVQTVGWWGSPGAQRGSATPPAAMAVSLSGHKFGAPTGIGALVLPPGMPCDPLDRRRRAGTHVALGHSQRGRRGCHGGGADGRAGVESRQR